MNSMNNNNIMSSVVISNDTISRRIKVNNNGKIEDFYQQIIYKCPLTNSLNMKLFYYEGYSLKKLFVSNEIEFITAMKKGIEYFYFDYNSSNDNDINFLKYHSVIIFSPIRVLNSELQINLRKKMQIQQINQPINIIPEYQTIDSETNPINKYIENAINFSNVMKYEILKEKKSNPNRFIDISSTLRNPGLLSNLGPSPNDYKYILCLIGKILENNGIIVGIYKDNNIQDRIDLSTVQLIFSGLISRKKYRLAFNVNQEIINNVLNNLDYRKYFIDKWKEIIAKRIYTDKNLIILTNARQRTYLYLDLAFNFSITKVNEDQLQKCIIGGEIIACESIPLLSGLRLSPSIFNQQYHKFYEFNLNYNIGKRGGEEYIPPFSWTAYGINISGKYDYGNNAWLGNKNENGEFAVAYYGLNNLITNNSYDSQYLVGLMGNLESGNTFRDVNNIRNPGQKCNTGAYFYKNPIFAENSCQKINIGGFGYKIMFMCRVKPSKIKQPENFQDCWILSPTPNEVRPYKILVKKIISSLAFSSQQVIKMCLDNPDPSYFQILKEKDESFFNKRNLNLGISGIYSNLNNYDYVINLYSQCSEINYYLRDPNNINNNQFNYFIQNTSLKDKKSNVWCLHKALTRNSQIIPNGTVVYRGVHFRLSNDIGTGTKFYFPEFLSTSLDINIAKDFAENGTLMIITIQNNGTDGKKVYCRNIEEVSDYPNQKEVVFTAYCQFRITDVKRTPSLDYMYLTCEGHHFKY